MDGAVVGLSPELIKNLKRGLFSYQDYVDLHGCTCQEAHDTVIRFLNRSFAQRYRCVLIVSGRGLNSREREPVLKQELVRWLTHARCGGWCWLSPRRAPMTVVPGPFMCCCAARKEKPPLSFPRDNGT